MNVAFVMDGRLVVPQTSDTVLSGVTRDSAIQLMRAEGIVVEERRVTVQELMDAVQSGALTEAFGLGTARRSHRFAHLDSNGDHDMPNHENWRIAPMVKEMLDGVRYGTGKDDFGWNIPV